MADRAVGRFLGRSPSFELQQGGIVADQGRAVIRNCNVHSYMIKGEVPDVSAVETISGKSAEHRILGVSFWLLRHRSSCVLAAAPAGKTKPDVAQRYVLDRTIRQTCDRTSGPVGLARLNVTDAHVA